MSADPKPLRYTTIISEPPTSGPNECASCRIIGSGALGVTGIYALISARPSAPGSITGKRIVAGIGVCLLAGSVVRWKGWREQART